MVFTQLSTVKALNGLKPHSWDGKLCSGVDNGCGLGTRGQDPASVQGAALVAGAEKDHWLLTGVVYEQRLCRVGHESSRQGLCTH